jgi:hypothetical protein
MPKKFDSCVKNGGKVRTLIINEKKGTYMHICYDKKGNSYPGEVHTKKKGKANQVDKLVADLKELERYWYDRNNKKKG